jgi:DNA-binding transcriptional ArsR family regulator
MFRPGSKHRARTPSAHGTIGHGIRRRMFAHRSRVAMIDVLLDGREHAVGALARAAGIAASTATGHLSRLEEAGVVVVRRNRRQRLVQLAGSSVAGAWEALSELSDESEANGLRAWTRREQLRAARTCYDHLAGRLGVAIADAALAAGAVEPDFSLGRGARAWFGELGVDLDALPRGRRPLFASAPTGPSDASTSPVRSAPRSVPSCSARAGRSGSRRRGRSG